MFREMRRAQQALSVKDCAAILEKGTSGVLATDGDGGYPYTVPLSYAFVDGKLYFHCALTGHKLDAIRRNNKVSFCVTGKDEVAPEEYTTHFTSVIAFGRARILETPQEKKKALQAIAEKYSPEQREEAKAEIEKLLDKTCAIEVKIEHLSGKAAIEVIRENRRFQKAEK
ncbi:MAG: pyridoxamine 5'-phosphate oxidase family protein [Christensenella sp.]|nr:pyridoxamine 5'-phosphate oxidase family protein [Christensenella sp.]